jgi:hypothetical protein
MKVEACQEFEQAIKAFERSKEHSELGNKDKAIDELLMAVELLIEVIKIEVERGDEQ